MDTKEEKKRVKTKMDLLAFLFSVYSQLDRGVFVNSNADCSFVDGDTLDFLISQLFDSDDKLEVIEKGNENDAFKATLTESDYDYIEYFVSIDGLEIAIYDI